MSVSCPESSRRRMSSSCARPFALSTIALGWVGMSGERRMRGSEFRGALGLETRPERVGGRLVGNREDEGVGFELRRDKAANGMLGFDEHT